MSNGSGATCSQRPNSPTMILKPNTDALMNSSWRANIGFSSHHVGGVHMAMADGGIRFVSSNINFPTWCYLGSKQDGIPAILE